MGHAEEARRQFRTRLGHDLKMSQLDITALDIWPDYARGFSFAWSLAPSTFDLPPYRFTVELGETQDGPWTAISPVLEDTYLWEDEGLVAVSHAPVLYYRVKGDFGGRVSYSVVRQPYGDLPRREFLVARNIRRIELLNMVKLSGTVADMYVRSVFGPKCAACTDPVTGGVVNPACTACFGTGRTPGYHGPYRIWVSFSPSQVHTSLETGQPSVSHSAAHEVRMLGSPRAKKHDIIVDKASGKHYIVDMVASLAELRRIPLTQMLKVDELPVTDPVYRIGGTQ